MCRDNVVFVSATSLFSGGGLTILNQFLESIDENHQYLIFIDDNAHFETNKSNITFVNVKRGVWSRLKWDYFSYWFYAKKNNIKPKAIVSLQNTCVFFPGAKQIVYLHQGIPFSNTEWSFIKRSERKYAFYKHVYPFFIFSLYRRDIHYVVQTTWMKASMMERFSIDGEKISVIKPSFVSSSTETGYFPNIEHEIALFYPASEELFKNHRFIFECIRKIGSKNRHKVGFYLTLEPDCELSKKAVEMGIESNVVFMGNLKFSEVQASYKCMSALVFPTSIESYGLPLLEASTKGVPIICNNTKFCQELIGSYDGATIIELEHEPWCKAILSLSKKQVFPEYTPTFQSSWLDFFDIITK
ncbi:glycosyltransferase [Vibrio caribbeanicus]|uniref:glycosyltransferase n=1 Tax=Vibrio caribbeanicus TaxID=701175 RepID=UPI0022835C04|nr:glycosyltransferase [Vibrio caribbeanicus]MCY9844243.1 glycosyltransferase [Vibrio caribbeanicus]